MTLVHLAYSETNQVEIVPGIWLGCFASSFDREFLKKNSIGLVVNMTELATPLGERMDGITYLRFPMFDTLIEDEQAAHKYHRLFGLAADQIHRFRTEYPEKNVLVHCVAGINRSSTALAYYLIRHQAMSPENTIALLVERNRSQRKLDCLTNRDFRSMLCGLSGMKVLVKDPQSEAMKVLIGNPQNEAMKVSIKD